MGQYNPMRGSSNYYKGMRVQNMNKETMQETMEREMQEAMAMMIRANRAIDRLFNMQEGEEEDE
jgi:hypothetical protein